MKDLSDNSTAVEGHNNPPPYDEELRAALEAEVNDLADAAGEWAEVGEIADQELAEKANDFLAQGRKLVSRIEAVRKDAKEPHLEAGRTVDKAFNTLKEIVTTAASKVKPMVEAYLKELQRIENEKRRAEQEKAQREAEAAEKARREAEVRNDAVGEVEAQERAEATQAAVKASQKETKARVSSASGAGRTGSLRKVKRAVLTNDLAALRHYRTHQEVRALLERLATQEVRAKGGPSQIPGFEIVTETKL